MHRFALRGHTRLVRCIIGSDIVCPTLGYWLTPSKLRWHQTNLVHHSNRLPHQQVVAPPVGAEVTVAPMRSGANRTRPVCHFLVFFPRADAPLEWRSSAHRHEVWCARLSRPSIGFSNKVARCTWTRGQCTRPLSPSSSASRKVVWCALSGAS